jgi:hypothetical protein
VPAEPVLHFGMLVRGVGVRDHVSLPIGRDHMIDRAQELQPLLMAVVKSRKNRSTMFSQEQSTPGVFRSVEGLIIAIEECIGRHNENPKPLSGRPRPPTLWKKSNASAEPSIIGILHDALS